MLTSLDYLLSSLALSGRDSLLSLLHALVIAVTIFQIYKYNYRGKDYKLTFMTTLGFLAPSVEVVMMFIHFGLGRSFVLIG